MNSTEKCRVCGNTVTVMAYKGLGICGGACEKRDLTEPSVPALGSAVLANATEPVRSEPECAT